MADWLALLRSACDRTQMAAVRSSRSAFWRAGMSPRGLAGAVSANDCFLQQKIGRGATVALKWPRIHGLITNCPRRATQRWALSSLTGASTIARRSNLVSDRAGHIVNMICVLPACIVTREVTACHGPCEPAPATSESSGFSGGKRMFQTLVFFEILLANKISILLCRQKARGRPSPTACGTSPTFEVFVVDQSSRIGHLLPPPPPHIWARKQGQAIPPKWQALQAG